MPIILSQLPPKCDAGGGLNFQTMRLSSRNAFILLSFTMFKCSSEAAPTKFVPLSDLNSETAPRIATNRLMALTNEEEVISSMTSMWTALLYRQVNNTAQRFECALPPLVCLVMIVQGPNTSTPTKVKGGDLVSRSLGRYAIFRLIGFPLILRHATH